MPAVSWRTVVPALMVILGLATTAAVIGAFAIAVLGSGDAADSRYRGLGTVRGSPETGDLVAGARVWVEARCGACHTLALAGAAGTRGPDLDRHLAAHPHSFEEIVQIVALGRGRMPGAAGRMSDKEIADVAAFVIAAASASRR